MAGTEKTTVCLQCSIVGNKDGGDVQCYAMSVMPVVCWPRSLTAQEKPELIGIDSLRFQSGYQVPASTASTGMCVCAAGVSVLPVLRVCRWINGPQSASKQPSPGIQRTYKDLTDGIVGHADSCRGFSTCQHTHSRPAYICPVQGQTQSDGISTPQSVLLSCIHYFQLTTSGVIETLLELSG